MFIIVKLTIKKKEDVIPDAILQNLLKNITIKSGECNIHPTGFVNPKNRYEKIVLII